MSKTPCSCYAYPYKNGEFVWARMKGYQPWPAICIDAPWYFLDRCVKGSKVCVAFFGTHNFAWMTLDNIKPWNGPWRDELLNIKQSKNYAKALQEADDYENNIDSCNLKNCIQKTLDSEKIKAIKDGCDILRPYTRMLEPVRTDGEDNVDSEDDESVPSPSIAAANRERDELAKDRKMRMELAHLMNCENDSSSSSDGWPN